MLGAIKEKTAEYMPEQAPVPIEDKGGTVYYPRDSKKKAQALFDAYYCCEVDPSHITFIRKANGKKYTEAHHLIPMEYQKDFSPVSLDVPANIVSLCSNCHNEIHYGTDEGKRKLL
jgi:5-methylcytosine-specific restriction protein A